MLEKYKLISDGKVLKLLNPKGEMMHRISKIKILPITPRNQNNIKIVAEIFGTDLELETDSSNVTLIQDHIKAKRTLQRYIKKNRNLAERISNLKKENAEIRIEIEREKRKARKIPGADPEALDKSTRYIGEKETIEA